MSWRANKLECPAENRWDGSDAQAEQVEELNRTEGSKQMSKFADKRTTRRRLRSWHGEIIVQDKKHKPIFIFQKEETKYSNSLMSDIYSSSSFPLYSQCKSLFFATLFVCFLSLYDFVECKMTLTHIQLRPTDDSLTLAYVMTMTMNVWYHDQNRCILESFHGAQYVKELATCSSISSENKRHDK